MVVYNNEEGKLKNYNPELMQFLLNKSPNDIDEYLTKNQIDINFDGLYFKYETQPNQSINYLAIVINNNRQEMKDIIKVLLKFGADPRKNFKDSERNALDIWNINHSNQPFPSI